MEILWRIETDIQVWSETLSYAAVFSVYHAGLVAEKASLQLPALLPVYARMAAVDI